MLQACHFERDDIALPGFYKFFKKNSDEEREHAQRFIKFLNERGGRVKMEHIQVSHQIHNTGHGQF